MASQSRDETIVSNDLNGVIATVRQVVYDYSGASIQFNSMTVNNTAAASTVWRAP